MSGEAWWLDDEDRDDETAYRRRERKWQQAIEEEDVWYLGQIPFIVDAVRPSVARMVADDGRARPYVATMGLSGYLLDNPRGFTREPRRRRVYWIKDGPAEQHARRLYAYLRSERARQGLYPLTRLDFFPGVPA